MADPMCPGQIETIHRFLDGELSQTERETFLSHLPTCPTCQEWLTQLQTLFARLDSLASVAAPPGLVDQVMRQLPPARPAPRHFSLEQLALAGQIAAGLALLLFSLPFIMGLLQAGVRQTWPYGAAMAGTLGQWPVELGYNLIDQFQAYWPPGPILPEMMVSPEVALVIIAGLALAWIIGNGLLLGRPSSIKNGGAS